jgi:beta-N-acetylhexosaminidase
MTGTAAVILGCAGPRLTADEIALFRDARPWGFILFARNVRDPDQVRRLVDDLRETVGDPHAPVLVDQEGGRVQRLGPPHWPTYPAARAFAAIADPFLRREAVRLSARLMAADLERLGVNVDCAPVCDLPAPGGHEVIGDRAYGVSPGEVAVLARAAAEGLLAGRVLPIIKHIPGHGRALSDSHEDLPVVDASLEEMDGGDFAPFRALSDMPMAMTAHVVFSAVDAHDPATTSPAVILRVVRKRLGFEGLLVSDDLSMKALQGDLASRARLAAAAGCDVVLHCNGDLEEMAQVAAGTPVLGGAAARRASAALARLPAAAEPLDEVGARARLASWLRGGGA